jgi:ATP-dependent Clp protease ATP-binding subunit ClpA
MSYFEPKSTWSYYCKNCGRNQSEHIFDPRFMFYMCPIRDNSNQMARRTRKKEDMNIPEGAVTPPVAKPEVPLATQLKRKIAGQDHVVDALVPYYEIWKAGLSPEGRPAGIFFLLGPTGTGKTALVEALAEAVHGSTKNIVKIDCGEYQMEHEVAKLIGSPPGYLGHRETVPRITQNILTAATSGSSNLSIVLFDEIEKAASSMVRLLLGVLDKSTLRLGDNAVVNFDRTFIFFTSNVGSTEMAQSRETWGFGGTDKAEMKALGTRALRRDKKFSTEFLNRVDEVLVYEPLTRDVGERIAQMELVKLQAFLEVRKGAAAPRLIWGDDVVRFLGEMVTDLTTGAREMKRYIHRGILKEVASLVGSGEGGEVVLMVGDGKVEVRGEEVGRAAA